MKSNLKSLLSDEMPVEKLIEKGAGSLTDAELLSVVLRTGVKGENVLDLSRRILNAPFKGPGLTGLYDLSFSELTEIKGVGSVKAAQILSVGEICKRISASPRRIGYFYKSPSDIADKYMEDLRHLQCEHVILILLDTKCRVIKEITLSIGAVNYSVVSPREIFIHAVKNQAVYIALLHNHPSGDSTPSRDDIDVTARVREAGEMIGISLIDHIIIGDMEYTSLRENGLL